MAPHTMTAAGVPCNLVLWPWSKEEAPHCAWRWGNSQPVDRGQRHHQELGWLSPYLPFLPGWALVGRHGIWTWSPSSP